MGSIRRLIYTREASVADAFLLAVHETIQTFAKMFATAKKRAALLTVRARLGTLLALQLLLELTDHNEVHSQEGVLEFLCLFWIFAFQKIIDVNLYVRLEIFGQKLVGPSRLRPLFQGQLRTHFAILSSVQKQSTTDCPCVAMSWP